MSNPLKASIDMIRPLEAVPADRSFVADGGAADEVAGAVLEVGETEEDGA
jgi:hypothetical protein